jgi:lysophospholipase L1-like esterase
VFLLLLSPLLLLWLQGQWVRKRTPRLPDAAGPAFGVVNDGGVLFRLLVVGESTVAGVGAPDHESALTGQIARALALRCGDRAIHWRAVGKSGATARDLLSGDVEPADAIVIALGVNDVLRFGSGQRFASDLKALIAVLRKGRATPVVLAGVPPMGRFPALPQPLRALLGWRAASLERAARRLDAIHCDSVVEANPVMFASDGFHPSPAGYARWGSEIAKVIPIS